MALNETEHPAVPQQRRGILALDEGKLAGAMHEMGQPPFRAKQVFGWLHKRGAATFDEMTDLPAALRTALKEAFFIERPVVAEQQKAVDGTVKYLLRLHDGECVEAVLMRYRYGHTLCISSQVGCRMGCAFCASTGAGFVRNLSAGEMAGEVYTAEAASGQVINRVVLMGIGEPLDNFENVVGFVRLITSPAGKDMSGRHVSLSTCGVVPQMRRLAALKLPLTLSVSLHATEDETRTQMMPVNRRYPLAQLLAACRAYQNETGRRVSFEYALVAGVNDSPKDAARLAALLAGMGAHVNLIPVNPVQQGGEDAAAQKAPAADTQAGAAGAKPAARFAPSGSAQVEAFRKRLEDGGITATVRRRLGADIDAACGQLRRTHKDR